MRFGLLRAMCGAEVWVGKACCVLARDTVCGLEKEFFVEWCVCGGLDRLFLVCFSGRVLFGDGLEVEFAFE